MIRTLAAFLALGLLPGTLLAQDPEKDTKIQFSVTRFDPRDRPIPEFIIKNGSTETQMRVPLTHIAGPFTATLRDGKHLEFFQPDSKAPVITTVIPPALREDLLLVFIPQEDTFEILKIHAPDAAIKGGAHYVINATTAEVAVKFGSLEPVLLPSRKAAILHDPSAGKSLTVPVVIRRKEGEEWKLVTTENWPHDTRFRTFLFLYKSMRDHHMAFHAITQRVD
jgi:hypothetical protein